jgi:uncharacterized protein (TIGR03435 family)
MERVANWRNQMRLACVALAIVSATAAAQSFEVASIRSSAPPGNGRFNIGMRGGPGTRDPGRFICDLCNLSMLVTAAFDVKNFQVTGPSSLNTERFDVAATIADGATKERFRIMLQNLLAERFKMTVHHEKKEMAVYELVVAKGGPKMKESAEEPAGRDDAGKGPTTTFSFGSGPSTYNAKGQTMEQLANMLANRVGKPVTDATGLKGKYDYSLTFARDVAGVPPPADGDSGPTIFAAVQTLGLKLEQKKGMVDIVVVDHIEKVPTEN